MPSTRATLIADFAATLADPNGPAEVVTIGGVELAAIRDQQTLLPGPEDGLLVERQTLYFLSTALGYLPTVGQEVLVDGERWQVIACPQADPVRLDLQRWRT